jgi:peptidoglycan/LPS O-acetylase OafA/YrhL
MHVLFMQFLSPISSASYNINGSLWTLTMEAIFYLILPWVVVLFLRKRWFITLPCAVGLTLVWLFLAKNSLNPLVSYFQSTVAKYGATELGMRNFLSKQFPAHLADFSLGVCLANVYLCYNLKKSTSRIFAQLTSKVAGNIYFVLGIVTIIYALNKTRSDPNPFFYYYLDEIFPAFAYTLLIAGVLFGGGWQKAFFSFTLFRIIGIVGYSIFLWHMPLIYLFNSYPQIAAMRPEQRFPQVLLNTSIAVFMLGIAFYLLVEKPFMLKVRKQDKPTEPVSAAVLPERAQEVSVNSDI